MKKRRIFVIIFACLLLLIAILLYIPKRAQATLWCCSLDGNAVQVEIDLTYHWRLFTTPFAKGTVFFDGVEYMDADSTYKTFPWREDNGFAWSIEHLYTPDFHYANTTFYKKPAENTTQATDIIGISQNSVMFWNCTDWPTFEKLHIMYMDESMEVDGHVSGVSYYGPAKTAEEAQVLAEHFQR